MLSADPAFLEWRDHPSRATLRRLLQASQDRVYSLCFQVLRHAHDAEDAAQASLLEIARGVGSLKDPGAFTSWIYRVCLNNALTLRRESRRRKVREERRAPLVTAPAVDDLRDAVHDALAALDDDERALVVEHYFEKTTLDELGARRGVSGVAVWKRIEHAKERMKRALAGAGLAIGLTQMNSVLEAAEFTSAPKGFSVDGALAPVARGTILPRVLIGVAVMAIAIVTTILVLPKFPHFTVAAPATVAPPVPTPPEPITVVETPAPAPVQEESDRVVDPVGNPIQGALVFPGRWYRLRGDDAFDLFRPHSIKDGVKTDAEGRFSLETKSPFITAWHDEFSPATVPATDSKVIKMKARGTLKGRLVDAAGMGQEGVEITLDKRGSKATTDKDGRFQFEKVIAGFRGLILPDRRWIAVRVDPGETLNVEIGPGLDIDLDLGAHPKGPGVDLNGMLLGTGRTWSLTGVRGATPSAQLKGVIPGRYFYGEFRRGPRGWVEISDKGARVEFGASILVIDAEKRLSFYLLPAECNEILEVALMKDGDFKVGPGESVKIEHLTEGEYEIRDREGRTIEKFKVGPGETRIVLR